MKGRLVWTENGLSSVKGWLVWTENGLSSVKGRLVWTENGLSSVKGWLVWTENSVKTVTEDTQSNCQLPHDRPTVTIQLAHVGSCWIKSHTGIFCCKRFNSE